MSIYYTFFFFVFYHFAFEGKGKTNWKGRENRSRKGVLRNGITFFFLRNINSSIQREPWVRIGTDDGSGSDLGGSEIVRFE